MYWGCPVILHFAVGLMLSTASVQASGQLEPVITALLPLPDSLRQGATVVTAGGEILRQGRNGLTCRVDPPGDYRLSLVCYSSSLQPYMQRSAELSSDGYGGREFRARLGDEVRTGRIHLPAGSLIRNVSGAIDSLTGRIDSVRVWSEILLPYASAAELGIPTANSGRDPWMMSEGSVGAHVMIRYRWVRWGDLVGTARDDS